MGIKLYVRQILNTSALANFDFNNYTDVIFDGNPKLARRMPDHYNYIKMNFNELAEVADCVKNGKETFYPDFKEACADLLPRENSYSVDEVGLIECVLRSWNMGIMCREDCYSLLLTIIEHRQYDWKQIHGSIQSEWQTIYYPKNNYGEADLMALEREYFNLGTAWEVVEDSSGMLEINNANRLDGFESETITHLSNDLWEVKQELAQFYGYLPEEIRLFPCIGTKTVITYIYGSGI